MLSRRYLATAVLLGGLAATAVVPAVAAASTPSDAPPTATVSSTPTAGSPSAQAPSQAPAGVVSTPKGPGCAYVNSADGRQVIQMLPSTGQTAARQAAECAELLKRGAKGLPKGAPQTGGGGMAAEVSSWG